MEVNSWHRGVLVQEVVELEINTKLALWSSRFCCSLNIPYSSPGPNSSCPNWSPGFHANRCSSISLLGWSMLIISYIGTQCNLMHHQLRPAVPPLPPLTSCLQHILRVRFTIRSVALQILHTPNSCFVFVRTHIELDCLSQSTHAWPGSSSWAQQRHYRGLCPPFVCLLLLLASSHLSALLPLLLVAPLMLLPLYDLPFLLLCLPPPLCLTVSASCNTSTTASCSSVIAMVVHVHHCEADSIWCGAG